MHEPLEADIVTYAAMGHEMAEGKHLYTDVWDVKPPGLYATYEVGELLAGYGEREVFVLGLATALLTLLAVYAAGAALGRGAGLLAALCWTVVCGTLVVQANQPNSEVFINAACAWAFALMARHPADRPGWARAAAVGLALGVGSTYKPVVVFVAFFLAAGHVWIPPRGLTRRQAFAEVAVIGASAAAVWAAVFAYAAASGQMAIYWTTNVMANRHRGGGLLFNLYRYIREGKILPRALFFVVPMLLFIGFAAVRRLRQGQSREWLLFCALAAGVHLMIFSQGGAFHPHSYQMWLPALAIGFGWATATLSGDAALATAGPQWRRLGPALAVASMAVVLFHEVPNYFRPATEWARLKYGDDTVGAPPFARAVAGLLRPSETLFEYGNGASFYFYGKLRPTTPTLWSSHLLPETPLGRELTEVTLSRLKQRPPDLFVVDRSWTERPQPPPAKPGLAVRLLAPPTEPELAWTQSPVYLWALENYRPWTPDGHLAVQSPHYQLLVRRGSDLERRLASN